MTSSTVPANTGPANTGLSNTGPSNTGRSGTVPATGVTAKGGGATSTSLGDAYRAPSQLRVRPYLLTGGRTKADIELALETTLETTDEGTQARPGLTLERLQIIDVCHQPIPLVELAARLRLPLQVVRVLVGDLVTEGLLNANAGPRTTSERPDLALLERVLDGLQHL